jgi:hypothetical protein
VTAEPESRRQAQRWEQVKRRYLAVLGCHRDAAQAAWGTQCGFSVVHPPCESCRVKVATLPVPAAHGWRRFGEEPATPVSMSADAVPMSSDLGFLRRSLTGVGEAA